MNILLISQCEKKALTESRRILDQFGERRGDRTWQTPITLEGLATLRKLLKKTARKNTAIACHWIRGKDHSELLWIVGDSSRFNAMGASPTNSTQRNILRSKDENGWSNGALITLLTGVSALLHDIGKACDNFQEKLLRATVESNDGRNPRPLQANEYRHEWISLRLFQAFVTRANSNAKASNLSQDGNRDLPWIERLAVGETISEKEWLEDWTKDLVKDGVTPNAQEDLPLKSLDKYPLAMAVAWLVVSHHRLPMDEKAADGRKTVLTQWPDLFSASWNGAKPSDSAKTKATYWKFKAGLPMSHPIWRKSAAKYGRQILKYLSQNSVPIEPLSDPFVMHLSRMSLMLADHHYSSLNSNQLGTMDPERTVLEAQTGLFANTHAGKLNQGLEEHLLGVAKHAQQIVWALPSIAQDLPRIARHKGMQKRASAPQFRWQNKAFELAEGLRRRSHEEGAFIVNMASTGCGKTLANARIMYALSDPEKGMRCAFAIGLRTLTLQTGRAFQKQLNLDEDDLAIRVGNLASRELFERSLNEAENTGSASNVELLDETSHVLFDGNLEASPLLSKALRNPQVKALLVAPILVCTVDHLIPATESERGGRQIAPMLRLLSGDLVLDEPDDFDLDDLPALARLVNWAGLLGARVLLSSATLPPALVQGLFEAYREGRRYYIKNNSMDGARETVGPTICCMWVDEFSASHSSCPDVEKFEAAHTQFVEQRVVSLLKEPVRRKFEIWPISAANKSGVSSAFAQQAIEAASTLHSRHHLIAPVTGARVSFGLIRMANIGPLFEVAQAIYRLKLPENICIHLCVYHSQFPLVVRSDIEKQLDRVLDRRKDLEATLADSVVVDELDPTYADHVFVVLGSPVSEVGRDHDYDWAVVEPSSMRSIIQLAGRVRRHRSVAISQPNIVLFEHNVRHMKSPGVASYCKPGFETENLRFKNANLKALLASSLTGTINSIPRVRANSFEQLKPTESLVDLEHFRLSQLMQFDPNQVNASDWWRRSAYVQLTALMQRYKPFRKEDGKRLDLYLRPDEDGLNFELIQRMGVRQGRGRDFVDVNEEHKNHRVGADLLTNAQVRPWCASDYLNLIAELADERDEKPEWAARRFGTLSLRAAEKGWDSHPALGFSTKK